MLDNDARGLANLGPRDTVGMIYEGVQNINSHKIFKLWVNSEKKLF